LFDIRWERIKGSGRVQEVSEGAGGVRPTQLTKRKIIRVKAQHFTFSFDTLDYQ